MNPRLATMRSRLLWPLLAGIFSHAAFSADPAWWVTRGIVDTNLAAEDYGKLNLGQLKHMAAEARNELNTFLPGGAGPAVDALVNAWANTANADDFAVCNLGQLKSVAKPFYDRLIAEYWATAYPWTATTADDDDYAAANIGQLKKVFAFGSDVGDTDADGLPDAWEILYAASLAVLSGAGHDADGDGLTDSTEYALKTHPRSIDTDGDNVQDGDEVTIGWDPKVSALDDTMKTEALTYDAAHRLTGVSGRSTLGYTLDANANLTQTTHP